MQGFVFGAYGCVVAGTMNFSVGPYSKFDHLPDTAFIGYISFDKPRLPAGTGYHFNGFTTAFLEDIGNGDTTADFSQQ